MAKTRQEIRIAMGAIQQRAENGKPLKTDPDAKRSLLRDAKRLDLLDEFTPLQKLGDSATSAQRKRRKELATIINDPAKLDELVAADESEPTDEPDDVADGAEGENEDDPPVDVGGKKFPFSLVHEIELRLVKTRADWLVGQAQQKFQADFSAHQAQRRAELAIDLKQRRAEHDLELARERDAHMRQLDQSAEEHKMRLAREHDAHRRSISDEFASHRAKMDKEREAMNAELTEHRAYIENQRKGLGQ